MRLKLIFLFLLTVLIPTIFLVYFSLLAVEGERDIFETNIRQKHQAMADIMLRNIHTRLQTLSNEELLDVKKVRDILLEETQLFQDEVVVFTVSGKAIDGIQRDEKFGSPARVVPVEELPYKIAIYDEQHQDQMGQLGLIRKRIVRHIGIVGLSALAILLGGVLTLRQLLREWERTRSKSDILVGVAHDLRRPLTSIRMFSEMLQSGHVPNEEKRQEYYEIIALESSKLAHMIDNLLDFSRIENKKKSYDMQMTDLTAVVSDAVTRFQNYSPREKPDYRVTLHPSNDPIRPFLMDSEAIFRVLLNLLTNAAKYSPPGSEIKVIIQQNGDKAEVLVVDRGIGIAKKDRGMIFKKFYRSKSAGVQNREGMGLGLALARHAVSASKGALSVTSEEGRGSEFKITLPIRERSADV